MKTCKTCKYWKLTDHYDSELISDDGECHRIPDGTSIIIEVEAGWNGGTVGRVETQENFGCALHEERE